MLQPRRFRAVRSLIDSRVGISLRRAAATIYCRTGAESWLTPTNAVISHPKVGRTWLRVMLAEAGVRRVCFSHAGSGEQASLTIEPLRQIVPSWRHKRILLLLRDPRDTVVSFYFQATRRSRIFSGSFAEFLRDPRFGIERIVDFNLLWLSYRRRFTAFELLTYEQLHEETEFALKQAARFLSGRELDELELRRAVARASFEELHKIELSGEGWRRWGFRLSPGDRSDPESFKTRRGIIGGWREYLGPADRAYAEAIFEQTDYFARVDRVQNELSSDGTGLAAAA